MMMNLGQYKLVKSVLGVMYILQRGVMYIPRCGVMYIGVMYII